MQATGDLIFIAFYYLLRYGEYTAPRYIQRHDGTLKRATHTKQFMLGYVGFWRGGCKLPRNSPLHLLLQTTSANLKITNQKNRRMGKTIHHESFTSDLFS